MKQMPLVVVIMLCLTFAACHRNYYCTCTYTDVLGKTYTETQTISYKSKAEAKLMCDEIDSSYAARSTYTSCKFK